MGNIEKLVVLTVLFLSVIVLALSFSEKEGAPTEATTPLAAARARVADEGARGASQPVRKPAGLLSAEKSEAPRAQDPAPAGPAPSAETEAAPSARARDTGPVERRADGKEILLRTRVGLVPTEMDDYMVYRVQDGDTWGSISDTYYGRNLVPQLQAANEGLERLVVGERILVPIVDLTAGAGERAPFEPGPAAGFQAPGAASSASPVVQRTYEVQEGDSLSRISEKLWGTQKHWRELYEANRHLLASEDELDLGMRLVVPVLDDAD